MGEKAADEGKKKGCKHLNHNEGTNCGPEDDDTTLGNRIIGLQDG